MSSFGGESYHPLHQTVQTLDTGKLQRDYTLQQQKSVRRKALAKLIPVNAYKAQHKRRGNAFLKTIYLVINS